MTTLKKSKAPSRRRVSNDNLALVHQATTKSLLIEAGERLIAKYGFDGVTLQDITEAAGQANSSAVHYHFKDKTGLIEAILEDRSRRREELRAHRLKTLKENGKHHDVHELLGALWLPSLDQKDSEGKHIFCHFAIQCLMQADLAGRRLIQEFFESGQSPGSKAISSTVLREVLGLLQNTCKALPARVLQSRISALSLMFIASVVEFDNTPAKRPVPKQFDPEPLLDLAVSALSGKIQR